MKYNLKKKLNSTFLKLLITPIVLLVVFSVLILVALRGYMFTKIESAELQKATNIIQLGIQREKDFLNDESIFHKGLNLENRLEELLVKPQPYKAQMLIFNKKQELVSFSSGLTLEKEKEFHSFIVDMLKTKVKMKEIVVNDDGYVVLQTSLSCLGSTLIVLVDKKEIHSTLIMIKSLSQIIVFSLLLLFFILLYGVYKYTVKSFTKLSKNIIDPIIQLSVISANIEKYQKDLPRFKTKIIEVDELGSNFSKMVESLNQKTEELEKFNSTLEEKIKEATRSIREKSHMTEQLFSTVMESISVCDEHYNVADINETTYKIFDYNSKSEMIGKNMFEFVPPEEEYKIKASLKKSSITPYEVNLYKKGNVLFPALVKGSDIYINNKLHRIVTVIDLTDVKEKDKLLVLQSKQAQMGEMISMIAHQWRQPLNAISASSINLSLLSSMNMLKEEKIQESSEFVQEQCQKMSSTIDTFMNFVKPSKESREFNLAVTVDSIMQIMQSQLENHNITVVRDDMDSEVSIVGYEDLLEQVILNILTNARDAFEELKIENKVIRISVARKENIPTIFIEDNAGGIPKAIQEKIFNPYFTTKEQGKGTGIGLYMSIDIMQKSFHGNLFYHEVKDGSSFEIACGGGKQ